MTVGPSSGSKELQKIRFNAAECAAAALEGRERITCRSGRRRSSNGSRGGDKTKSNICIYIIVSENDADFSSW